jgi:uncharacterized protein YabE (DUF348 family)
LALAGLAGVRSLGATAVPITVTVDGQTLELTSARPDVGALLRDLRLTPAPEDRLSPPAGTPLRSGLTVVLARARPMTVRADGAARQVRGHATTAGELATLAGVRLGPRDELWLDGVRATAETPLPAARSSADGTAPGRYPWHVPAAAPVDLAVRRAVPITVDDGSVPMIFHTTAETVGEALVEEGIIVYAGDRISPAMGAPVRADQRVFIQRSTPVLVSADGHTRHLRTRGESVGDALHEMGIILAGRDRVSPEMDEPLQDHLAIGVVRVAESTALESERIDFEAISVPDDTLEIDTQRLAQPGAPGELRRRYRIVTEDGVEKERTLTDEWVAAQPVNRQTAYGRKLVSRTVDTPEGPRSYWRKVRMYATSYSPARAGTPKSAPWYGRTRIGLQLRKGIVAVDPKLIPLRSYVYVPGYGVAIAGDTGGGVRGKWIDMGFSDDDYESWHRWTDVYVLDPPPPPNKIMWVLPNYPPPDFPRRRK